MATLVLTAVGTALGGPLGGALGAILGQSADALLFAPKARQGPRLTDLKVQTSSYGDAIPRLYGTTRGARLKCAPGLAQWRCRSGRRSGLMWPEWQTKFGGLPSGGLKAMV